MEISFICECGNEHFWYFWHYVRCTKCFNEYKDEISREVAAGYESEHWMRRFDKTKNQYPDNWEKSKITYKK